jgi:hypothetical protein
VFTLTNIQDKGEYNKIWNDFIISRTNAFNIPNVRRYFVHDFKKQINYTEFTIVNSGIDIVTFCVEGYEEVILKEPGDPFNVKKTFYSIKITSKPHESTTSSSVIYHTTEQKSVLCFFTARVLLKYDVDMRRVNDAIKYSLPWNSNAAHLPTVMVFKGQNRGYMEAFINRLENSGNSVSEQEPRRDLTYTLRIPCLDPQYNPTRIEMQIKIKTDYSVEVKLKGPAPAVQLDLPFSFFYFYNEILRLRNFICTESSNHHTRPGT